MKLRVLLTISFFWALVVSGGDILAQENKEKNNNSVIYYYYNTALLDVSGAANSYGYNYQDKLARDISYPFQKSLEAYIKIKNAQKEQIGDNLQYHPAKVYEYSKLDSSELKNKVEYSVMSFVVTTYSDTTYAFFVFPYHYNQYSNDTIYGLISDSIPKIEQSNFFASLQTSENIVGTYGRDKFEQYTSYANVKFIQELFNQCKETDNYGQEYTLNSLVHAYFSCNKSYIQSFVNVIKNLGGAIIDEQEMQVNKIAQNYPQTTQIMKVYDAIASADIYKEKEEKELLFKMDSIWIKDFSKKSSFDERTIWGKEDANNLKYIYDALVSKFKAKLKMKKDVAQYMEEYHKSTDKEKDFKNTPNKIILLLKTLTHNYINEAPVSFDTEINAAQEILNDYNTYLKRKRQEMSEMPPSEQPTTTNMPKDGSLFAISNETIDKKVEGIIVNILANNIRIGTLHDVKQTKPIVHESGVEFSIIFENLGSVFSSKKLPLGEYTYQGMETDNRSMRDIINKIYDDCSNNIVGGKLLCYYTGSADGTPYKTQTPLELKGDIPNDESTFFGVIKSGQRQSYIFKDIKESRNSDEKNLILAYMRVWQKKKYIEQECSEATKTQEVEAIVHESEGEYYRYVNLEVKIRAVKKE